MNATHSPGEWEAVLEGHDPNGHPLFVIIAREEPYAVARLYTGCETDNPGRVEANARLMAAAPAMLKAAESVLRWAKGLPATINPLPLQSLWEATEAAKGGAK